MFRNYLKIAWRNLWKDRTFSFLNIIGLSVAFSVAILLCTYALFELSYDRFHENADKIYQVYTTDHHPEGPEASTSKSVPFAGALQEEVPGVEKITRFNGTGVLVLNGENELRMTAVYVDPEFFSIFTFPVVKGKKEDPIGDKSAVAITEYAANRIFGETDVVGETISVMTEGEERPFTVSAVLRDMPENSSMMFDLALDFTNQSHFAYADNIGRWEKENHEVYMQLAQGISASEFEESTDAFTTLHYEEGIKRAKRDGAQPSADGKYKQIRLLPYQDIRFAKSQVGVLTATRTWAYLVLGIAFLIIFIAGATLSLYQ